METNPMSSATTQSVEPASLSAPPVSSPGLGDTDVPNDFALMMEMARALSEADAYLPEALQGSPGNVLALMLRARALNIPLAVACDELYSPDKRGGGVRIHARLVKALARRAGHRFMVQESNELHCVLLVQLRGETSPHRIEFTMQDAHRMGLTDPEGNNADGRWDRNPKDLLHARAVTRAVSRLCPEVLLGMGSAFLYEESPTDGEDTANMSLSDVVAAYQEQDKQQVAEVLRLAEDAEFIDSGAEREEVLTKLGMKYAKVLPYAADGTCEYPVRHVLLSKLQAATIRKDRQAQGLEVPPVPVREAAAKKTPGAAKKAARGATGARAATAKKTAAKKAAPARKTAAKKTAAPRKAAVPTQRTASPRPADSGTASPATVTPRKRVSAKRDNRVLPCGCDADQVLMRGTHGEECKDAEGTRDAG